MLFSWLVISNGLTMRNVITSMTLTEPDRIRIVWRLPHLLESDCLDVVLVILFLAYKKRIANILWSDTNWRKIGNLCLSLHFHGFEAQQVTRISLWYPHVVTLRSSRLQWKQRFWSVKCSLTRWNGDDWVFSCFLPLKLPFVFYFKFLEIFDPLAKYCSIQIPLRGLTQPLSHIAEQHLPRQAVSSFNTRR